MDATEKIKQLEEEIEKTKYNKATQHHIGKLKAKIAQLREQIETQKKSKGKGLGFGVKKQGHATVALVGLPSVGKSTLLNRLTNAESKVGAYEFTTLDVVPGMMTYEAVNIQLLDLPGLIIGAAGGKGRGREVLSMVRNADLVIIVLDYNRLPAGERIKEELEGVGVRLDCEPPDVSIKKRDRGGMNVTWTVKRHQLTDETVKAVLSTRSIHNADVVIREDISEDELVDAVMDNRIYIPSIVAVNKSDVGDRSKLPSDYIPISAEKNINLKRLRELVFQKLNFIRVYMKPQGEKPDLEEPMILKNGETIEDLCRKLHKDFYKKFRYAMIWGKSVKHEGQRVGFPHRLRDKDIVSIIKEL